MKKLDDHYTEMGIEPIVYSDSNNLDPYQHTIIKYVTRFRAKGGVRDLKAAQLLLQIYIDKEEATTAKENDEIHLLKDLVNQIPKGKYTSIVSTGRGAGWLVANLAYALGIKEIRILSAHEIYQLNSNETLFVDSIVDTGRTLQSVLVDSAALIVRHSTSCWPTYHARIVDEDFYIDFPIGQMFDNQKEKECK